MTASHTATGSRSRLGTHQNWGSARPMSPAYMGNIAGFTYLTTLIFLAMMAASATVVSAFWHTVQQREKEQELLFVGDEIRRAIMQYNAAAPGFPRRLDDLLKDPRFPGVRRYLRRIYPDPITGRAEWGLLKSTGEVIIGVHSLSEAEPLKKKGFAAVDRGFEGRKKYSEWIFAAGALSGTVTPAGTDGQGFDPMRAGTQPQPGTGVDKQ